ncbi:hypothetical protein [Kangiella sediminilitoris]|uniref:hypothetical protein n=1 Tax=Kangiella sediminilitoris TaxID=1144748 RepID=UPI00083DFC5D|nr:hypothetical protein [Kangiella sediminilitoris]
MSALVRLLGVTVLFVFAFQANAKSKDFCELYPITIPNSLVGSSTDNSVFEQLPLGNGQGSLIQAMFMATTSLVRLKTVANTTLCTMDWVQHEA